MPRLAKLSRPRTHGAVARERLFQALDAARANHSATYISGPPGAGKTTLVSTWLDARAISGAWYHLDAGDGDLSTFFYYLSTVAEAFPGSPATRLPLLTAEYAHDVPGFARRFFREFWLRAPPDSVLVFDNFQEVPSGSPFHEIVPLTLAELAPGSTIVIISRLLVPQSLARHRANQDLAIVAWEELRFTPDETRVAAARRGPVPESAIQTLHQATAGWAAGLTLMLEEAAWSHHDGFEVHGTNAEVAFDYFASQIFDRASEDVQRFLMLTACLSRITVEGAISLTGQTDAADTLEALYRRQLFTHRTAGPAPAYTYHNLFITFLTARAERLVPSAELAAVRGRAGEILESEGLVDDAVVLYRQGREWQRLHELLLSNAPALLSQGRGRVLRDWVAFLPQEHIRAAPWIRYWVGMSLVPEDPVEARISLERTHDDFCAREDRRGQQLAACGVIEALYREWEGFCPLPRWIASIEECLEAASVLDDPATALRVYSTLVLATLYGQPGHPMLPEFVAHALALLDVDLPANTRATAAAYLLTYATLGMKFDVGARVMSRIEPLMSRPEMTPVNQFLWRARLGYFHYMRGEHVEGAASVERAEAVAEAHGLAVADRVLVLLAHYRLALAAAEGDRAVAAANLERVTALGWRRRSVDQWSMSCARVDLNLAFGVVAESLSASREAVLGARASGMVYMLARALAVNASTAARCGATDEAQTVLTELRATVAGTCLDYFLIEAKLIEAEQALVVSPGPVARAAIAQAFGLARERGYRFHDHMHRQRFISLAAAALDRNIETEFVGGLIGVFRWTSPPGRPEAWPWPVRIYTLGRFEIQLNGERLVFSGRAPRKPLQLLKSIIAFGGERVPQTRLLDALWPNEDADLAVKAYGVALLRLRRLLGRSDALVTSEQTVSIQHDICWTDVDALNANLDSIKAGEDPCETNDNVERVASLYRGPFLGEEPDAVWAVALRARLARRFGEFIELVAGQYERQDRWDIAIEWYRRGLAADDLTEAFYQGLMRCYLALGRPADGIAAFRRLRHMLSIVLNVAPSPESERLAQALRVGAG